MQHRKVYQIIAGAGVGDAITNYAFSLRHVFDKWGVTSKIFAPLPHIAQEFMDTEVFPLESLEAQVSEQDVVLYHYSIGSVATDTYKTTKANRVLCYHNITPAKYFRNLNAKQAETLERGREELKECLPLSRYITAVSEYNAEELRELGYQNVTVLPLVISMDYLTAPVNKDLIRKFQKSGKETFLFVGRVAPNKRHEDVIKLFYYYKKLVNPESRLVLAGSYGWSDPYATFLKSFIFELGLFNDVLLTNHISLNDLISYYRIADAFICLSEHEGFCLPLIEAMYFDVPVFAMNNAAIPETMGNAGVLFKTKDHLRNAMFVGEVLKDRQIVTRIRETQKNRLKAFDMSKLEQKLAELFEYGRPH